MLPEKYWVHTSTVQVSTQNMHLLQSHSKDFVAAVNAATYYRPITDPLHLSMLYKRGYNLMPDIPKDDKFLQFLLFMATCMVYTLFITRGLVRLYVNQFNARLQP